jgi:hypothetical protein
MKLEKLVESRPYLEARARVRRWNAALDKGGKKEALAVRQEKEEFFSKLRRSRQDLYSAFQLDDKTLSERIHKALTGKGVILG